MKKTSSTKANIFGRKERTMMEKIIKAGYARKIISPPKGIYLIGYGDRFWGNKGIHDDLTASALALEDGDHRIVIVACDLLAINEFTLQQVINGTNEKILVCCSHTHSGPIVYKHQNSSKKNRLYVDFLVKQLVDAIHEAASDMQYASLNWGESVVNLAINRRERKPDGKIEIGKNPEGFIDRSVGIIQIKGQDGKPLANLINLSCHNVVLGPSNLLVSADWAGNMRKRIENDTGTPCLFIQGAAADLNPDHEWGDNDFDAVDQIGMSTASDVLSGFSDLNPIDCQTIKLAEKDIWLHLESQVKSTNPPKTYQKVLSKLTKLPKFMVDPILNIRYPWETVIKPLNGYWSIPLKTSVLRLGEVTWVSLGAEVFNQIGWNIKNQTRSPYAFFSSLTNGCIGYLPTEEEYVLGGYEVDLAPYFYRLPGRLKADSAKNVILEIAELIEQVESEREIF